ncbi:carboxylesterase 3-like [Mizuhopecten yessoensis]|uniref:Carboxylic ester hydrolase n=1 Tax=Mizuhopecten yessoensis TaxID=6573 RepID=A0A210PTQ0_MIZYE|nr:carboxylesterase 3-like [Mizuhopecten yessoensis]OWF39887.1 Cholinesterase [Mizuhopecten yessoensis]
MGMTIAIWLLMMSFIASDVDCQIFNSVNTSLGPVRGLKTSVLTGNIYQFRAIPYGKAPMGELRLRKPEPFGKWSGTYDATKFGPSCVQDMNTFRVGDNFLPNYNISEDCLQLNIFVPTSASPTNRKSVIVWLYGGAFVSGQSGLYDGSYLTFIGDVIVVTLNYRVGILGFYSTGDDAAPGNYGLWDQLLAIRWIKDNIEAFGGNSNSITLFGESAGAMSASIHALNPNNKGLFHRAIFESGTANQEAAFNLEIPAYAQEYGILLNCTNDNNKHPNTTEMVDCIRTRSVQEILKSQQEHVVKKYGEFILDFSIFPVVDGDLIPIHPMIIIKNASSPAYQFLQSLDVIGGTNSGEGSLLIDYHGKSMERLWGLNLTEGISTDDFCSKIATEIAKDFYHNRLHVAKEICLMYTSDVSDQDQALNVTKMYGDMVMQAPTVSYLDRHAKDNTQSNTFQYLLSHENCIKYHRDPSWFKGFPHASDLPYLFRPNYIGTLINADCPEDTKLSDRFIKYWSNFAKTGDPNGAGLPDWPMYNLTSYRYLNLNNNATDEGRLYWDRVQFWNIHLQYARMDKINSSDTQINGSYSQIHYSSIVYIVTALLVVFLVPRGVL